MAADGVGAEPCAVEAALAKCCHAAESRCIEDSTSCNLREEVDNRPSTPSTSASLTAVSSVADFEDHGEGILLCSDQAQWLEHVAAEQRLFQDASSGHPCGYVDSEPARRIPQPLSDGACLALQRLVDRANREPPKAKRQIFLSVRCRRCLQHSRGGAKKEYVIGLPQHHWTWLEGVQNRSKHASIGKTLRIIVDFYKPICEADGGFAAQLFGKCNEFPTGIACDDLAKASSFARLGA